MLEGIIVGAMVIVCAIYIIRRARASINSKQCACCSGGKSCKGRKYC